MTAERRTGTLPDGTRRNRASWAAGERRDATSLRDALDTLLSGSPESAVGGAVGDGAETFGTSHEVVVIVAHVVQRAHEALHEAEPITEAKVVRCADVLFTGLPESVANRLIRADAVAQVRYLAKERDPDRAVPIATAALLGWTDVATHALAVVVQDIVERHAPEQG